MKKFQKSSQNSKYEFKKVPKSVPKVPKSVPKGPKSVPKGPNQF